MTASGDVEGRRRLLLRVAALVEATGGVLLAAAVLNLLIKAGPRPVVLAVAGALALVAGLALLAGAWLWQGTLRGRVLSLAVQALQLPHVVTPSLIYLFGTPASVAVGLGPDGSPHASTMFRPGLNITPGADPDTAWIGVNLLALFVTAVVLGTWRLRPSGPGEGQAGAGALPPPAP